MLSMYMCIHRHHSDTRIEADATCGHYGSLDNPSMWGGGAWSKQKCVGHESTDLAVGGHAYEEAF